MRASLRNSFSDFHQKARQAQEPAERFVRTPAFIADEDTVFFIFYSENVSGNSMNCNKMWKEHLKLIHWLLFDEQW